MTPDERREFDELQADCLVLALGQNADLSVLADVPGVTFADHVVEVGPDLMTGHPGIFAGGDMVPSERTVTVAIGHGKKAARQIDAWLRGVSGRVSPDRELAGFDRALLALPDAMLPEVDDALAAIRAHWPIASADIRSRTWPPLLCGCSSAGSRPTLWAL